MKTSLKTAALFIVFFILVIVLFVNFDQTASMHQKEYAAQSEFSQNAALIRNAIHTQTQIINLQLSNLLKDNSFIHSVVLANEFGFTNRPRGILNDYVSNQNIDLYILKTNSGEILSNIEIDDKNVCQYNCHNAELNYFTIDGKSYVFVCSQIAYNSETIGDLGFGLLINPSLQKVLQTALSRDVKVLSIKDELVDATQQYVFSLSEYSNKAPEKILVQKQNFISSKHVELKVYILCLFAIISAGYFLFWYFFTRRLREIYKKMLENFAADNGVDEPVYKIDEISSIETAITNLFLKLKTYKMHEKEQLRIETTKNVAIQIAHDIRAPLTVLEQITSNQNLDYDKKMILQATKRIQSISENLLNFNKTESLTNVLQPKHISMNCVLKNMIAEKRLQSQNSKIVFSPDLNFQNLFLSSHAQLSDLERILSNLINNALEVLNGNSGEIKIVLESKTKTHAQIQIIDNGKGIPPEILAKLCQKGATFGKNNGNGLGLYHAKKTVEEWGGEFKIESQVGVGTTVSFTIPVVEAPNYFALQLVVQSDAHIVVLDDDQSIIDGWRNRFSKLASFHGRVTAFTTIADFENWLGQQGSNKNFIFLCDFDLGDSQIFGLDVIAKHNLQSQSVLVTGRAEDVEIQKRVEALGTKLLPKEWIEDIEIQVLPNNTKINEHTAVLIDDDELIRGLWQNKAKAKNISLVCYESSHDFTTNISKYPCQTAIYVDSDLKGERGEEFVKYLATNGFLNVTLTTGYPRSKFQNMPWITRVIDKSPPW